MTHTLPSDTLLTWTTDVISAWGYSRDDAQYIAHTLVDANLRGVDSHGVMRLPAYYKRITSGLIDPAETVSTTTRGATAKISAHKVSGQLAAREATAVSAAIAGDLGVAAVTVSGSAHFGAAGYYARQLAEQGFFSLVASNSEPIVVPFGGKKALLGTNPLALAAPTETGVVSVDMATSQAAMGKVFGARLANTPIPADWGVDENGQPTTDPHQVQALLPAGGPKGYALGFFVEMLSAVLSGSAMSLEVGDMYNDFSKTQNVGHFFLAISIDGFMPRKDFERRAEGLVALAHGSEPVNPERPVLVPGEPELMTAKTRSESGIPLSDGVVGELNELGASLGVAFPS
jgi:LDH2 family malate/lactate/ureidoglycolate dehydrogenase